VGGWPTGIGRQKKEWAEDAVPGKTGREKKGSPTGGEWDMKTNIAKGESGLGRRKNMRKKGIYQQRM